MTIHALVIDDNADNLSVIAQMLSLEGAQPITVQISKELITRITKNTTFDIVFLDLEMPDIDGYEIFNTLRSDKRFSDVPIIGHSVHISEIGNARAMGFDGFIGKPLDAEAFPNQLQRILNGKSVWSIP